MTGAKELKGFFAFNVTPTEDDGESISRSRLRRYLVYLIEQGVHSFSMIRSTAGGGSLDEPVCEYVGRHTPLRRTSGAIKIAH